MNHRFVRNNKCGFTPLLFRVICCTIKANWYTIHSFFRQFLKHIHNCLVVSSHYPFVWVFIHSLILLDCKFKKKFLSKQALMFPITRKAKVQNPLCVCVLLRSLGPNVVFIFWKYPDQILKFLVKLSSPYTWFLIFLLIFILIMLYCIYIYLW